MGSTLPDEGLALNIPGYLFGGKRQAVQSKNGTVRLYIRRRQRESAGGGASRRRSGEIYDFTPLLL